MVGPLRGLGAPRFFIARETPACHRPARKSANHYVQQIKGVSDQWEDLEKVYIVETKIVSQSSATWVAEKKGLKNGGHPL